MGRLDGRVAIVSGGLLLRLLAFLGFRHAKRTGPINATV